MNQRFLPVEIKRVSEQYAENELYQAICQIGLQLEAELTEFGLCPEECIVETLELLTVIADKGANVLPEIEQIWFSKHNEYKRFDRRVDNEEICKAVGIVFGFAILALGSSSNHFYKFTLTQQLMQIIANHKFDGWASMLDKIFSIPLTDGWFDTFIEKEPQEGDEIVLPKELDTKNARKYFAKAIERNYMEITDDGKYNWLGTNDKGNRSELAYFLGKVYGYVHTISGNAGEDFPEDSLNKLFGVSRIYSSLTQVYNAQKPQRWRALIDSLFD